MRDLLLLLIITCFHPILRAQTIEELLKSNHVPTSSLDQTFLHRPLSGLDSGKPLLFAFGDQNGYIRVIRLTPEQGQVTLQQSTVLASQVQNDPCMEKQVGAEDFGAYILLNVHINPSASCTLVLGSDLKFRDSILGWPIARLGNSRLLIQRDEVHFAPVHPVHLSVYDISIRDSAPVYPSDNDPLRQRFSAELKEHVPAEQWCREQNNPCNPNEFDEDLTDASSSDGSVSAFQFVMDYSPEAFGEGAVRDVHTRSVQYFYKQMGTQWNFCEREIAAVDPNPQHKTVQNDSKTTAKSCSPYLPATVRRDDSPFNSHN